MIRAFSWDEFARQFRKPVVITACEARLKEEVLPQCQSIIPKTLH